MKNAPHSATMTYMMWPMFMMMGMSMFAYLFARSACSKRWSLTRSKSRFASSSWQNTLTTFCPFIISSMKPSVLPMARCCSRKNLPEPPPMTLVMKVIATMPTTTMSVRYRL